MSTPPEPDHFDDVHLLEEDETQPPRPGEEVADVLGSKPPCRRPPAGKVRSARGLRLEVGASAEARAPGTSNRLRVAPYAPLDPVRGVVGVLQRQLAGRDGGG